MNSQLRQEDEVSTEAERDSADPVAVAEAVRCIRSYLDGDDTLAVGRWSIGVLMAKYDQRGERIANLEAGREVEQHMVRNAAVQLQEAMRQRDAVLALHQPSHPDRRYASCTECTHGCGVGDVDWPCSTVHTLRGAS